MSSELENSDIRVGVSDCSVTEHLRWRPPYQTGKTVLVHAMTPGMRQWFCTADPLKITLLQELEYTHTHHIICAGPLTEHH